mgnify:CR=1 FL=1
MEYTTGTNSYTTTYFYQGTNNDSANDTLTIPFIIDPYIDWLPNSCLYPKYIPVWHLVKSYSKHACEPPYI